MNNIAILQAYRVMLRCFDNIFLQTQNDDLRIMMSSAALYSAHMGKEPETMDPAVWRDWMDAVKVVLKDQTVTFDSVDLTLEQAYQATYQYFVIYCDIGCLKPIGVLRDLMKNNTDNAELSVWLHEKWIKALNAIVQEELPDKIGHFFTGDTPISMRESFMVIKKFLDTWCQKIKDAQLIQLLRSVRFKNREDYWSEIPNVFDKQVFEIWQKAIEQTLRQEEAQEITIFIAYKAMPNFLTLYFKDQSATIQDLIQSFDVVSDETFIVRRLADLWLTAAVEVNAEQEEMVYGLVTIHTAIDHHVAKIIIKEWLHNFVEIISQDVLNRLFANNIASNMLWSKAFGDILEQQRSYVLLDNEITVLETYYVMLHLLESLHLDTTIFTLDEEAKPHDFLIFLRWLKLSESIYVFF